ncbi:MAG: GntR family transcriptional regulator [Clostridia bacterium BRH_c25]|nr:MAG: GntR family transcriptional regulator [Clostridia bacterium BRH_c25]
MFTPIKNKRVYEQVIEQIQDMVLKGMLNKGDKLVSERELAEQLQVSRTSVREAIRSLEIIGLVESRQGEGNFISGNMEDGFFQPLSMLFALNHGRSADILELRKILEVETTSLAAARIKEEQKPEILELMQKLKDSGTEAESAEYDKQLHFKIAEVSGNYLIISLLHGVSSILDDFIHNARELILRNKESKSLLIEQHQKICDSLVAGDSLNAGRYMREHLEYINSVIKEMEEK